VRTVGSVLHLPDAVLPWLWTGVAVSLMFFLGALVYVQRLALQLGLTEAAATHAAWLLACYPFSLFYGQHYTEALFLLCAVLAVYHFTRGRLLCSAVFGFSAGLVRPTGILVAVPLIVLAYQLAKSRQRPFLWFTATAAAIAPALGLAAYAAYIYSVTGDSLAWMEAQSRFGREWGFPWLPLVDLAR